MKTKEIRLSSFKSFRDETRVLLNTGITAFVGPNGSGKSNIFDALRWVFGEQSMKALRCERIEDLIYVSPDAKDDAGFTEVSLIIENEDYFPQFGSEFEIKRRFFRTGESEFYLNRVKCRLQDIQALFLNSGALTYSFLELAEIERIIHGDTKEMFDDVSGILKYQERKEQTKKRLEATEQDLLRLEDIILEMQRGLRSLRRQVRQAKLYHDLREEYKVLNLYILYREHQAALQDVGAIQKRINDRELTKQGILHEIKKCEDEREKLKSTMAQAETARKETLEQIASLDRSIKRLQQNIGEREEELKNKALLCERLQTSIKEKGEILINDKKRLLDLESERSEILKNISSLTAHINAHQTEIDSKQQNYFLLRDKTEEREVSINQLSSESANFKNEIARLQFENANRESVLARINDELNIKKDEIKNKKYVRKELEKELDAVLELQREADDRLKKTHEKLDVQEKKFVEIEADLKERNETIVDCKVIIDTLTHRLQTESGVKNIESIFQGKIDGLVREHLEVSSGYEPIVDICLGDLLNFFLLKDYKAEDFAKLPEGRFGFINTRANVERNPMARLPEGVICITQFIRFKSNQQNLGKHVSNYFLTDDYKVADELSLKFPEYGFVTPNGVLFKDGIIIIEKGEIGYFKISQRLEDHKEKLETLQNEKLFLDEEKKRLTEEIEKIKSDIEEWKNRLCTIIIQKSEYTIKLNALTKEIEKGLQEIANIEEDRDNIQKEIEEMTNQLVQLGKKLEDVQNKIASEDREKDDLSININQIKNEIDVQNTALNKMLTEMAVLEDRKIGVIKSIDNLNNEIKSLEDEISILKEESPVANLNDLIENVEESKKDLDAKKKEKAECESKLPDKIIKDYTNNQEIIYDKLTEKQKEHEQVQDEMMQLKYALFQTTHKRDEAIKKALEDFNVDLKEYIPEEEIDDSENKIAEVRGRIEKLGEVNPLSLQTYEEEKKRLDEFLAQRDDIIAAKKNLLKSIEELDQRAQDRFNDVFQQVKKEFNYVFSNFFEDGQADLILTNPESPLSSNVEIVIRMMGRKLKTINQLSGGQKTLLAISLLLAFYLVKPAPFCILDEIDAPLDDINVLRFNKFLRDLSQRTQVVIITHNRATMEYADYLYGLTMEKPRQSKVISARLADLEKIGTAEETF